MLLTQANQPEAYKISRMHMPCDPTYGEQFRRFHGRWAKTVLNDACNLADSHAMLTAIMDGGSFGKGDDIRHTLTHKERKVFDLWANSQ